MPKKEEFYGIDYHFVTKEVIEEKMLNKEFIMYKEVQGDMYGIEKDQIDDIIENG